MENMECPYCGAEWESDIEDYSCADSPEEYECPDCGKVMIMTGEIQISFYSEKSEDYYTKIYERAKRMLSLYERDRAEARTEDDKERYQNMIDVFYRPDVEKAEAALKRCREHNAELPERKDR